MFSFSDLKENDAGKIVKTMDVSCSCFFLYLKNLGAEGGGFKRKTKMQILNLTIKKHAFFFGQKNH